MASSFLLKSLQVGNISEEGLQSFFEGDIEIKMRYARTLSGLRECMINKGAHNALTKMGKYNLYSY
mgnify:CR=1 FL=1